MTGVGYKGPRKDRLLNSRAEGLPELFKGETAERLEDRFKAEAEDLLENVLLRRRWTAPDRDKVAAFLIRLVEQEVAAANRRAGRLR